MPGWGFSTGSSLARGSVSEGRSGSSCIRPGSSSIHWLSNWKPPSVRVGWVKIWVDSSSVSCQLLSSGSSRSSSGSPAGERDGGPYEAIASAAESLMGMSLLISKNGPLLEFFVMLISFPLLLEVDLLVGNLALPTLGLKLTLCLCF